MGPAIMASISKKYQGDGTCNHGVHQQNISGGWDLQSWRPSAKKSGGWDLQSWRPSANNIRGMGPAIMASISKKY
jgi:hypothetical protein